LLDASVFNKCVLVIAGGYDPLNEENKVYYNELVNATNELKLDNNVIFLKSPSTLVLNMIQILSVFR
jgi:hypothetical protein